MTVVNLGLLLDAIGVVLVWRFGLPPEISRHGHSSILLEGVDEAEKRKAQIYDWLSRLGLFLIVLGFIVQIIGNIIARS